MAGGENELAPEGFWGGFSEKKTNGFGEGGGAAAL